ncbi:MAG: hypothetical protein Q7U12_07150 [Undibacterium sp.]|nr:hypothetical protein [Undibacterium sp.]
MDKMLQAAQIALDVPLRYLNSGSNMAIAALAGAKQFVLLQHYPAKDVIDLVHHTRFFYHGHSCRNQHQNEHGHFHIFVYFPESKTALSEVENFSHLVALSLDEKGQALRWFTTNRWVTAETWRPAKELIALLPGLRLSTNGRLAPVARWLDAMLILFRPQIESLLLERDVVLAKEVNLQSQLPAKQQIKMQHEHAVFDNREIDVISECPASLHAHLQKMMSIPTTIELKNI